MADILKKARSFLHTPLGRVMEMIVYAIMLALVCIYFTGSGVFIYEIF